MAVDKPGEAGLAGVAHDLFQAFFVGEPLACSVFDALVHLYAAGRLAEDAPAELSNFLKN